jgi:hypothetical protein
MKVEIDQSGKVEDTAVKTVIGDSLGNVVVLRAKDKRAIQAVYRLAGIPRIYMIHVFSLLTALVIAKTISKGAEYTIDAEYPGREDEIATLITGFLEKLGYADAKLPMQFLRVGKSSLAHEAAHAAFKQKGLRQHVDQAYVLKLLLPIATKKDREYVSR